MTRLRQIALLEVVANMTKNEEIVSSVFWTDMTIIAFMKYWNAFWLCL